MEPGPHQRSAHLQARGIRSHGADEPVWSALHQRFITEFSARKVRVEQGLSTAAGSFDASVARALSSLGNPLSSVNLTAKADGKASETKPTSIASNSAPGDRG